MSLEILKAGILDTIQDAGRHGYAKWGIGPGGVMDCYASHVANALVGNDADAAVIEMHFPAPQVLFHCDVLVALTGADLAPSLQRDEIPVWKPVLLKAGNVLSFHRRNKGARCYLAVRGGFGVVPWLGSCSTNLKTNVGGFQGRALKKGDVVPLLENRFSKVIPGAFKALPWSANYTQVYGDSDEICFTSGHEWNWLSEMSQGSLLTQSFTIGSASDRMAYHVSHPPLTFRKKHELLSSAVCAGTIQALPGGNLLILMADHQTTGGYPRIGHVATAHLPRLAQMNGGEAFRLKKISVEESEKMLVSLGHDLRNIYAACRKNLEMYEAAR